MTELSLDGMVYATLERLSERPVSAGTYVFLADSKYVAVSWPAPERIERGNVERKGYGVSENAGDRIDSILRREDVVGVLTDSQRVLEFITGRMRGRMHQIRDREFLHYRGRELLFFPLETQTPDRYRGPLRMEKVC